jgi:WD40 repeat protein
VWLTGSKSAEMVEQESGLSLESSHVKKFRQALLSGDYDRVESLLSSLGIKEDSEPVSSLARLTWLLNVKFLIRRQKYLEALEEQDLTHALDILRRQLTPLDINVQDVHHLSSLMMCNTIEDVKSLANWDGAQGDSRHQLLISIQKYISPSVMIPERRLENLLQQAFELQRMECVYHNTEDSDMSLFYDHECSREQFPSKLVHVLEDHMDEVWFVSFSHNGRWLASASKDCQAILWDTKVGIF